MSNDILNKILEQLNSISKEQQEMKRDIANMKENTVDIPAMKVAILETNETVTRIESTQEKHERTLDLLSRRSIDQEAELKRIK